MRRVDGGDYFEFYFVDVHDRREMDGRNHRFVAWMGGRLMMKCGFLVAERMEYRMMFNASREPVPQTKNESWNR